MKLRYRDPREMARRRVRRGVRWLNRHAPLGWERNLFTIRGDGSTRIRAKTQYDNECHLALAFETDPMMRSAASGYVTFASVCRLLALKGSETVALGFDPDHVEHGAQILDDAWKEALYSYALPTNVPIRHGAVILVKEEDWIPVPHFFRWLFAW